MKRRPLLFWALFVLSVVATVWWSLHVPRDPRAPLRAIPVGATWVTAHYNLAGRWDAISAHPLLASVAGALGIEVSEWRELADSADTHKFLQRIARDDVYLAYVPEMRMTGRPAWVFSAWLGGQSQRFRWALKSIKDPTLRRAASRNGWSVWVWTPKGLNNGERVTFALVEGMLVGCMAVDTLGIEDILACYDGYFSSLASMGSLAPVSADDALDRGWVRLPAEAGWGPPIRYTLDFRNDGGLDGTITVAGVPVESRPSPPLGSLDEFSSLLAGHPAAALVLDRSLAHAWLAAAADNPIGREVAALLQGDEPGAAAFALVGGPYSGRFMAVRLPSLLAAYSTPDPAGAQRGIHAAFDRLNAIAPWGLVPQPVLVGTQRVFAIESTGRSAYASLEARERLAYASFTQSMVFSSNVDVLAKLLRERGQTAPGDGVLADGMRRMRDQGALGYLWMDLDDGAKLIRLAITAWSLKLLVENPRESQPMRQRLNEAKAWIDALAPQRELRLWVRPRQDTLEYEFQLGGER
ncbi:MAG TPA: hypothetical protein PKE12_00770 [Kiritimatiellia bacterium]|nr:hypothetical protein [Kiritimatiellia bacterium]